MKPWRSLFLAAALVTAPAVAQSQTQTRAQTAGDGEDFARSIRDDASGTMLQDGAEQNVPGYGGTDIAASKYVDDADGLTDAGVSQRYADPNYGVVIDPARPVFDPTTIDLAAARLIEDDPESYIGTNLATGGSAGTCEPLPANGASGSTYYETCNAGDHLVTTAQTCTATLDVTAQVRTFWYYHMSEHGPYVDPASLEDEIAAGTCHATGSAPYCATFSEYGYSPASNCEKDFSDYPLQIMECSAQASVYGNTMFFPANTRYPVISVTTGQHWFRKDDAAPLVTATRNSSACTAFESNGQCVEQGAETCTDTEPVTRLINGVAVTQPCWAWSRSFACTERRAANDCGALAARSDCTFDHEECLSDNEDGSCNVQDMVYACTTPATGSTTPAAYICAGDLYCINGECTQVEREASSEFKDAMVAVQTMGNVSGEFDADTLTLFDGEQAGCHKPVFGLVNCCAGKTSGLLTTAAGAAAIASGPAAIAALATPFLATFLCDSEEMMLDVKDRMGLCHYVGSYCSDKVLGVCTSKRKSYCCFESKLSRVLQEQGRTQLGMDWGKAKESDCEGFLIEEFQQLDLSKMDFTEVYDEFVDAAKVPDEIQASIEIQEKITQYYQLHQGT